MTTVAYTNWNAPIAVNCISDRPAILSKLGLRKIKRDYETKSNKSLFAKYLIEQNHQLHPIENCMTILNHQQKGRK
jgi:hypothetical protein